MKREMAILVVDSVEVWVAVACVGAASLIVGAAVGAALALAWGCNHMDGSGE